MKFVYDVSTWETIFWAPIEDVHSIYKLPKLHLPMFDSHLPLTVSDASISVQPSQFYTFHTLTLNQPVLPISDNWKWRFIQILLRYNVGIVTILQCFALNTMLQKNIDLFEFIYTIAAIWQYWQQLSLLLLHLWWLYPQPDHAATSSPQTETGIVTKLIQPS